MPALTIPTTAVPQCPLCHSEEQGLFASGQDYEIATCDNFWKLVECSHCSHIWLNPRPSVESLTTIYPPSYYAYNYDTLVHPLAQKAKAWLDGRKMRGLLRRVKRPISSYLDVGCGNGRFLRYFAERGVAPRQLYGLELDDAVVQKLTQDGFQAYNQRVETCTSISEGSLDLATLFHVIEHLDDPLAVLRRMHDWLAPGGWIAVETPNIDSWDARLFKDNYWGGYHFPRHWNLFSPATLERTLLDAGYHTISFTYLSGHSFWMYSLHHILRHRWALPRLARWFDPVGGWRALPGLACITGGDYLRAAFGCRTSAMLALAQKG